MELNYEKTSTPSRSLVFGLLMSCLFTTNAESCSDCRLKELRISLSINKKHQYVMELSDVEVESILAQNESCYKKRLYDLSQWV